MKKLFFLSILLIAGIITSAQSETRKAAPYLEFPSIPPFNLLLTDSSSIYTRDNLPKNKPTLFMLFSPQCDHCRHQTDSIIANISSLKHIQIVMMTMLPFDQLKAFYEEYQLEKYSNIVVGRDYQFMFPAFFQVHALPVLGLYNKKRKLIEVFGGTLPISEILRKFKK